MTLKGVWLPLITPLMNGEFDEESYENLIDHYVPLGISGLIPLGTTGESPTVADDEFECIIDKTLAACNHRVPVYAGVGGNHTRAVLKKLKIAEKYGLDGILSVCPYYNRPGQQGLFEHFLKISEATNLNIIIYNIPYRTGVNLLNETLFRLSEQKNIVGVKDSNGDIRQTMDLILNKPEGFSVLTGEDMLFYLTLTMGGNGGILASAHLKTEQFIEILRLIHNNDFQAALDIWRSIQGMIPLLFQEPNPAPIKYCLNKMGRIRSSEVRLPLTSVSPDLQSRLDRI